MGDIGDLLRTFLVSGTIVSSINYIGNKYNPLVAGIVSGVPVSIPSMLLIHGREKQTEFIWSAFVMVSYLAIITGLCAYLMKKTNLSSATCVVISIIAWVFGAFLYYMYLLYTDGE